MKKCSSLRYCWCANCLRNIIIWFEKLPLKKRFFWMMYQKNWMIDPCTDKRPKYWKKCGVKATGTFNVGADVYFDAQNASYLTIEDNVWISSRSIILLHKRDISNYYKGVEYRSLPSKICPVKICKGAAIGMGTIILPGVTIGEGAVVGAGSLVSRDIPAWTVAVGRPAKVVKVLTTKEEAEALKQQVIQ